MSGRAAIARDGAVATVTVNRPEARNALDGETIDALIKALTEVEREGVIRCAILTGAGDRAFVAGADIKAMAGLDPIGARSFSEHGRRLCDLVEGMSIPVIAAVNGFALGAGCELALACDFIYAARGAKLGFPEVGLGVIPGMGGTQRLIGRVGVARARELIYSAAVIDADEAARIGLVNAVVEPAELLARVRAVAAAIARQAPLAVDAAKRAILRGGDLPLKSGVDFEQQLFAALFASADQEEGMRAFVDKRAPTWTGK
ncbi:MAG TPA: enoyl-CoA hydratase-related protein [Polyangia bacterium]|nr:enoyl-CoA hydratase-related protein [Polyangia bacterium]